MEICSRSGEWGGSAHGVGVGVGVGVSLLDCVALTLCAAGVEEASAETEGEPVSLLVQEGEREGEGEKEEACQEVPVDRQRATRTTFFLFFCHSECPGQCARTPVLFLLSRCISQPHILAGLRAREQRANCPAVAAVVAHEMLGALLVALAAAWCSGVDAQLALEIPWVMEGGSAWREGAVEYDGAADARGAARFFYYSLNEGFPDCSKNTPDTASATPVSFNGVWIVGDCLNQLVGFASPDGLPAPGGKLAPLWTWVAPLGAGFRLPEPRLTTPVIDPATGTLYVLVKDEVDPRLFALALNPADSTAAPTLLWTLDMGKIGGRNGNDANISFSSFSEDHAIFFYGARVWVPSQNFDGMAIVDPATGSPTTEPSYIITPGQWSDSHRLLGSAGSAGANWTQPIFSVHGSQYGIQRYDVATGNATAGGSRFNAFSQEFSHPVAVRFLSYALGRTDCVVASEWDPTGDIFISAVDSATMAPCGSWDPRGYYVRDASIAMPLWVSAPAVLYGGFSTVYLLYAVILPSGDAPSGRRSAWRSALVSVQIDQSGVYTNRPVDYYIMQGVHFNAAPLIVRDALGPGNHLAAVGSSDGKLHMFPASGFTATGPVLTHDIIKPLPAPVDPDFDNSNVGVSGNYLAASSGGSVAFIAHNGACWVQGRRGRGSGQQPLLTLFFAPFSLSPRARAGDAQEYWFCVVTGAMYPLAGEVTPSPTRPPLYVSPTPAPKSDNSAAIVKAREVDAAAAVFGTLGGVLLVCAAIVFLLPTAGFMMGGSRVVPAEVIKGAAHAAWGGVQAAGRGLAGALGRGGGGSGVTYTSASAAAAEPTSAPYRASESQGLLAKK